ncbi:bifunctional metallophosphatase/5'-nucleotidase [Amycolatopsis rubida]|uniref:Bifunctional metallophosphatase/5'-nucleotidase n=1 Tax=Amycolatopsis rubida TaxID=112413 RepID=A0ABX0BML1_9PSEU|nr:MULTISPECIES: bifunctional metallophosphatase/5'-nucleotidase [Amycolatopsis]MYW91887.1 bifunctional metallophosphatase/5'-nucleotidase [Amycolatopsis rubida]NEC56872.1 bifunctional metallophosphatase/5'-nucleotidase [Amycolatopsis rubida]OAP27958.1 Endonuclease YhcR precursor [Amycolatopsis sp. M39]
MKLFTRLAATAAAALATVAVTSAPAEAAQTTDVRIIAFNDLHGNLEPPSGSSGKITLQDGTKVDAGGAAYLSTHVKQLEAQVRNSMVLSSGDNVGASPVISALFHDEPTMDFLNELGVKASVVGNHEFDEGYQELLRMQFGGCNKTDGCQFRKSYDGARFPLLGSNVYFDNGLPALLPFSIQFSGGVPVGVIGATLKDLPSVVTPEAIKGLKFGDEVQAINRTADILDRLGVKAQVVLLHQGDEALPTAGPNDCEVQPNGDASAIAKKVTPKVDAIFSAHSHQQYNCVVNDPAGQPRPVIQGASFGRLLSVVDLKIDRRTRDVVRSQTKAHNEIVTRDVTADPAVTKLVDEAKTKAAPIANKQVGTITADLPAAGGSSGESPLGDVIADAQLEATKSNNAVIAMTNPGGIRADLTYKSSSAGEGDGVVTYGEAFTVQPFSNIMQTITLTGANLKNVLEQQWGQPGGTKILQISKSLHYTYSAAAPVGSRVSNITVNGTAVDPAAQYRVSVNNFLAAGGDGFTEFTKGTDLAGGPVDLDAFIAYLGAHPGIAPPPADRITATP